MALNAYLILKGAKQGQINGGVTQKGHENTIEVHSFTDEIISPRDATTGLPTGKRQHEPIVIVKVLDKSTPLLWQALVSNENLTQFVLQVYAQQPTEGGVNAGAGAEVMIYTISLTNATISSIRQYMADNEIATNASLPVREEISFTYQKITWTWTQGGITATDDWSAPVS
jgi:type VI secretion system secreted protein Hcp